MIQVCTDHSTWCDKCGEYLSTANPGVRVFEGERADSRRVLSPALHRGYARRADSAG